MDEKIEELKILLLQAYDIDDAPRIEAYEGKIAAIRQNAKADRGNANG